MKNHLRLLCIVSAIMTPQLGLAYVGPGAGISLLGALWGLIVGVVLAVGVILFWPIRMMLRKRKARLAAEQQDSVEASEPAAPASDSPEQDSSTA